MKVLYKVASLCACMLLLLFNTPNSKAQTIGLISHLSGSEDDGYVLFAPVTGSDTTYLIDKCGRAVHKWKGNYTPGLDVYLLPDGSLLRSGNYPNPVFDVEPGSAGGVIERYDWDGNLLWHYRISDSLQIQNHDICYLPSGNILAAVWEVISPAEELANGRNPINIGTSLWSAKIIEIKPIGTDSGAIVWTWRAWDHLIQDYDATKPNYGVVADHPELLNLNYVNLDAVASATVSDWLHFNAVTYNASLDQVMISFHNMDEIYIIDHSTDSATAAGHTGGVHNKGGDFMYRWGNPQAYGRGGPIAVALWQQHDPEWIPTGKYANQIMIFNNGNGRPLGNASSVDIIAPPIDSAGNYTIDPGQPYGPVSTSWSYKATPASSFYTAFMGGSQPLPNGNTLICQAIQGRLFEIDSSKNIVWNYINPVNNGSPLTQGATVFHMNQVYRCTFYPYSYSGFSGHVITPGLPIEVNPLPSTCVTEMAETITNEYKIELFPNPAHDELNISASAPVRKVAVSTILGQQLFTTSYSNEQEVVINISSLPSGMYIIRINDSQVKKFIKE